MCLRLHCTWSHPSKDGQPPFNDRFLHEPVSAISPSVFCPFVLEGNLLGLMAQFLWVKCPYCYPNISCSSKIQNGLPFWCRLTQVVLEKGSQTDVV